MPQPIPPGYHTVTPYLITKGAGDAIEFYKKAFGATETFRMTLPDGKTIGHAEIKIGTSPVMLADEAPDRGFRSPKSYGGTPLSLLLYVENADAVFEQAVAAGAEVLSPLENKFYGDRMGTIADPFGHHWTIGTHVEDVSEEEMRKRMEKNAGSAPAP
jgi:PhnB protein